jgi:hypothetical protein
MKKDSNKLPECKECKECKECVNGEITLVFANHSEQTLRSDYVYCNFCCPGGRATAGPKTNEVAITLDEYYGYLDKGWREVNPV